MQKLKKLLIVEMVQIKTTLYSWRVRGETLGGAGLKCYGLQIIYMFMCQYVGYIVWSSTEESSESYSNFEFEVFKDLPSKIPKPHWEHFQS